MESIKAFNKNIISLVITCYYEHDHDTLERMKISLDVARKMAKLPSNVRHSLENQKIAFFDFMVNEGAINNAINSCFASGTRDEVFNRAIVLGAAKTTMRQLCNMSSSEFAARRKALDITDTRARPQSLTVEEEVQLSELYKEIDIKGDRLENLIFLAEKSGLEINRIYTYFMSETLERVI